MKSATWVRIASVLQQARLLVSAPVVGVEQLSVRPHRQRSERQRGRSATTSSTRIRIRLPRVVVRGAAAASDGSRLLASVCSSGSTTLASILDLARVMGNHPTGV